MTTARSPLGVLKAQADRIAKIVKAVARGENPIEDRDGRIAAARHQANVVIGVVMDDKVLKIHLPWATIRATSEIGISEYILKHMREARDAAH